MAIEDVGILSLLLKKICKPTPVTPFRWASLSKVVALYEKMRLPRTGKMLESSQALGDMQLARSMASPSEIAKKEKEIRDAVKEHGTLPVMFYGSRFRYDLEVEKALVRASL